MTCSSSGRTGSVYWTIAGFTERTKGTTCGRKWNLNKPRTLPEGPRRENLLSEHLHTEEIGDDKTVCVGPCRSRKTGPCLPSFPSRYEPKTTPAPLEDPTKTRWYVSPSGPGVLSVPTSYDTRTKLGARVGRSGFKRDVTYLVATSPSDTRTYISVEFCLRRWTSFSVPRYVSTTRG